MFPWHYMRSDIFSMFKSCTTYHSEILPEKKVFNVWLFIRFLTHERRICKLLFFNIFHCMFSTGKLRLYSWKYHIASYWQYILRFLFITIDTYHILYRKLVLMFLWDNILKTCCISYFTSLVLTLLFLQPHFYLHRMIVLQRVGYGCYYYRWYSPHYLIHCRCRRAKSRTVSDALFWWIKAGRVQKRRDILRLNLKFQHGDNFRGVHNVINI